MSDKWHPLEHHLYREIKKNNLQSSSGLLLVSGGCDSIALLRAMASLAPSCSLKLKVLHFHHGIHENTEFRNQARQFVQDLCLSLVVEYSCVQNQDFSLKSEQELRDFRRNHIQNIAKDYDFVAWGHHQDDLLETRLIRLIRGTGGQGLQALRVFSERDFRPWLAISRTELESYLQNLQQKFLIDPSCADLRSWIRHEWLPMLDNKLSGASQSLARSLNNLAEELAVDMGESFMQDVIHSGLIDLKKFFISSSSHQKKILARYLLEKGQRDFTRGQIEEIIKNLDKPQKEHRFRVAGLYWHVNAKQIKADILPL